MKTKRYLVQGFLLLFCSMTAIAGSPSEELQHPQHPQKQEGKRPRIQTSASEKEIVFKPNAETGKVETAKTQAVKAIGKERKETAAKPKKKPHPKKTSERYRAFKTNIAYDAIAVPNLAFEIQCSEHISVELPVMFSGWDISDKHAVRTFAVQPEGRWWLEKSRDRPFLRCTRTHGIVQREMGRKPLSEHGASVIGRRCQLRIQTPFFQTLGSGIYLGSRLCQHEV